LISFKQLLPKKERFFSTMSTKRKKVIPKTQSKEGTVLAQIRNIIQQKLATPQVQLQLYESVFLYTKQPTVMYDVLVQRVSRIIAEFTETTLVEQSAQIEKKQFTWAPLAQWHRVVQIIDLAMGVIRRQRVAYSASTVIDPGVEYLPSLWHIACYQLYEFIKDSKYGNIIMQQLTTEIVGLFNSTTTEANISPAVRIFSGCDDAVALADRDAYPTSLHYTTDAFQAMVSKFCADVHRNNRILVLTGSPLPPPTEQFYQFIQKIESLAHTCHWPQLQNSVDNTIANYITQHADALTTWIEMRWDHDGDADVSQLIAAAAHFGVKTKAATDHLIYQMIFKQFVADFVGKSSADILTAVFTRRQSYRQRPNMHPMIITGIDIIIGSLFPRSAYVTIPSELALAACVSINTFASACWSWRVMPASQRAAWFVSLYEYISTMSVLDREQLAYEYIGKVSEHLLVIVDPEEIPFVIDSATDFLQHIRCPTNALANMQADIERARRAMATTTSSSDDITNILLSASDWPTTPIAVGTQSQPRWSQVHPQLVVAAQSPVTKWGKYYPSMNQGQGVSPLMINHSVSHCMVAVEAPDKRRCAVICTLLQAAILCHCQTAPITVPDLIERMGLSYTTILPHLYALLTAGVVKAPTFIQSIGTFDQMSPPIHISLEPAMWAELPVPCDVMPVAGDYTVCQDVMIAQSTVMAKTLVSVDSLETANTTAKQPTFQPMIFDSHGKIFQSKLACVQCAVMAKHTLDKLIATQTIQASAENNTQILRKTYAEAMMRLKTEREKEQNGGSIDTQ
jgi:hypothetical protein